jgi:hypothetical protein
MSDDFDTVRLRVLDHCNKGASDALVSEVGKAIHGAIIWIEKNHTLNYMERFVTFTLDPATENPRVTAFPANPKRIDFVRRILPIGVDGTQRFSQLTLTEPREIASIGYGSPQYYWLDGVQYIWFDSIVEELENYETSYIKYTGPLDDTTIHWLFDYAQDLVMALAMQKLAGYLREPKLPALYQPDFEREIQALLLADDEMRYTNANMVMKYGTVS